MQSVAADPNHEYAGAMHWLVADCYEKLKKAGAVSSDEADPIIEWAYQTLFDKYRNCPQVYYAALRLGHINLDKGRNATACIYFLWFAENAYREDEYMSELDQVLRAMEECKR